MTWVHVRCAQCGVDLLQSLRHLNENIKFGRKFFCSYNCQSNNRKRRSTFVCENPDCKISFERTPGNTSAHNFCSQTCAAIVHNKQRPRKIKICKNLNCGKEFFGSNIYCSLLCVPKTKPKYSKADLLYKIQSFYLKNKRIPLKTEFNSQWQAYKRVFGTWNKAIKEAGFEPNKEIFTHKFKACDNHVCDSFAEKIVDDWLFERGISHIRGAYYPNQSKFKTDFLINNKYWVEFLGLSGVLKRYDDLYIKKQKIAEDNNIKIIELYPKDLFPKSKLEQKLGFLLK